VEKTLQPGEQIVYISSFHWVYTTRALLPFAATLVLPLLGVLLGSPWLMILVLSLPSLAGLAYFFKRMTYKWTNRVVITNKRLIVQKGWPMRNTMDLGLDRILGHKIEEDAWGQTLGYGKFVLVGAGIGDIPLPGFMANPTRFRRALTGKLDEEDD
jgi:hypothetical protein